MPLRGEYIWDGSYLQGANTDIDDTGHAGAIMQKIAGNYAEDFMRALKEYHNTFSSMDQEQIETDPNYQKVEQAGYDLDQMETLIRELNNWDMGVNPDDVHSAFEILHALEPENYNKLELIEAMQVLNGGDARLYGVKHFGDIIIRDNSFEVWGWSKKTAKSILSAIYDMIGYEMETDPEEYNQEIDIYDYKTEKSYTMTIKELEQNPMQLSAVPPSVIQTKKGAMSILDPRSRGGSQNWQQHYTSESFFKFLKKRDSELYKEYKQL